jgi:hypothetical protein
MTSLCAWRADRPLCSSRSTRLGRDRRGIDLAVLAANDDGVLLGVFDALKPASLAAFCANATLIAFAAPVTHQGDD